MHKCKQCRISKIIKIKSIRSYVSQHSQLGATHFFQRTAPHSLLLSETECSSLHFFGDNALGMHALIWEKLPEFYHLAFHLHRPRSQPDGPVGSVPDMSLLAYHLTTIPLAFGMTSVPLRWRVRAQAIQTVSTPQIGAQPGQKAEHPFAPTGVDP